MSNCAVCEYPLADLPVETDVPTVCSTCATEDWPHPDLPSSGPGVCPDRIVLDRAEDDDE